VDAIKFRELLEKAKLRKQSESGAAALLDEMQKHNVAAVDLTNIMEDERDEEAVEETVSDILEEPSHEIPVERKILGVARDDIILNEKQALFRDTVVKGDDCVLIGAAGTGKTTSMRATTRSLIQHGNLSILNRGTKYLIAGRVGGAILSYTRKAVNNIRHAVVDELKPHTLTIHKLLEFSPIFYEIPDPNNRGVFKTTMRFEPQRNASNPLPPALEFLAFEESSMIGTELYKQLQEAMPHPHQEVFLGDIQQLPPVFGLAVLGFKMVELPVIELTEVYRQARNSPIIDLAWKLLEGNAELFNPKYELYDAKDMKGNTVQKRKFPVLEKFSRKNEDGEVKFHVWQKKLNADNGLFTTVKQFQVWEREGYYNPVEDIILCPFNKSFGTIELNKGIADYLGQKRKATVYEIIAGYNKHYLAVGDRVLYDKEDAYITAIRANGQYLGKKPAPASVNLDRWGHLRSEMTQQEKLQASVDTSEFDLAAIEAFMESNASDDRVQAASHVITIKMAYSDDLDDEIHLDSAAEVNNLLGGYALTVHKFQGSENERVFFVTHNSHAVLNQREMLYTAVTRAKKFLHIITEADFFFKGVKSQAVKGDTIEEKAKFFKGKKEEVEKLSKEGELQLTKHHSLEDKEGRAHTTISGNPAIKLSELPSLQLREAASLAAETWWNKSREIFGEIGPQPSLNFEMRTNKIVGRAWFTKGLIQLNPVWLAAGDYDEEVKEKLLNHTIPHEIAHIIAYRKWKDTKHGPFWKATMVKLGFQVNGRDTMPGLPDYLLAKQHLLEQVFEGKNVEMQQEETETEMEGTVS
jgi:hypothetical protein